MTAHIDPDFPQLISITIEGSTQAIDANLRMTALMGPTLSEMPEVIRHTVQRQPELRHIHDEHLQEAVARRARGSGFFASASKPESWTLLERLESQATLDSTFPAWVFDNSPIPDPSGMANGRCVSCARFASRTAQHQGAGSSFTAGRNALFA